LASLQHPAAGMQRAATAGKPVRSTYENESSKFAKQTPTQPELPPQKNKQKVLS